MTVSPFQFWTAWVTHPDALPPFTIYGRVIVVAPQGEWAGLAREGRI